MLTRLNGLFGHVQRNNLKTLGLLACFLILLEWTQIGFRVLPYWTRSYSAPAAYQTVKVEVPNKRTGATRTYTKRVKVEPPGFIERAGMVWTKFRQRTTFFDHDWYLILIVGLAYIAIACWWSEIIIRYETRARPLARKDAPELYNLVENLSMTAGLPCPRIEVIETQQLNAYAAGFFPSTSTIALTRGLIERLDRDELEAVIAHELVHIRDRDVRLMVMARACVDMVLPAMGSLVAKIRQHRWMSALTAIVLLAYLGFVFLLGFAIICSVVGAVAVATRFAISRTREFTADAGAVEITKNPAALVRALRKVARADIMPVSGFATQAMMFSSSAKTIFATHPDVEERVDAIMQLTGLSPWEVQSAPVVAVEAVRSTSPEPAPVFGRRRVVHGLSGRAAVQTMMSTPHTGPAPAAVFGRLPPAAEPTAAARRVHVPAADRLKGEPEALRHATGDWKEAWIASGRIDRIANRTVASIFRACMAPFVVSAVTMTFALALSLVILTVHKPLIGAPLLMLAAFVAHRFFGGRLADIWERLRRRLNAM